MSTPQVYFRGGKRKDLGLGSKKLTPVHSNYTKARTHIEAPFCIGCDGTAERPR